MKEEVGSSSFLKRLRILCLIEGVSTLILFFVAMPMKYLMGIPQAVSWPGRIHGGLFVLMIVAAILAIKKVPIRAKLAFMIMVAAVIPFGPFWMDKKLKQLAKD